MIAKPELERGNYIAYADEPGTIVSPGSGGGGGVALTLNAHYDSDTESNVLDTEITFNELKSAFDAGYTVRIVTVEETDGYKATVVGEMVSWKSMVSESFHSYNVWFYGEASNYELQAESPDSPMTM